jgi:catechol 2,3-dioxygenase-like lactoylglutathione lyase family enzyme
LITRLSQVTVVVKDQDEALRFYTQKLGLVKRSDDSSMPGLRWLTVSPKDQRYPEIVLQKPGPPFHDEDTVKSCWSGWGRIQFGSSIPTTAGRTMQK